MTDEQYVGWCTQHRSLFGGIEPAMFLAWRRVFEAAGYTAGELSEASDWLAGNAPPRWPADHLAGLTQRIRQRRAVEYRRETAVAEDGELGTCVLCSGTGRVVVPHRQGIREGRWVPIQMTRGTLSYYTEAVLCRCALGRWVGQHVTEESERPGVLVDYERLNPGWMQQMRARQQELLARADAPGLTEKNLEVRKILRDRLRGLCESAGIPLPAALQRLRIPGEEG